MRELIRHLYIETEGAEVLELRYYLLSQESDSVFSCEAQGGILYGVSVSVATNKLDAPEYVEVSDNGLTYLKSEALDFINEIADASVTPESFFVIVDEYVAGF